jgi:iron(III) transport system permease protein
MSERSLMREPLAMAIVVLLAFVLVASVAFPIYRVLAEPGVSEFGRILDEPGWQRALRHSLTMAVLSTTTATLLGLAYAWAIVYGRLPLRGFFHSIALLPLLSPPFVVAAAYPLLFGRRGIISYELLDHPLNVYGRNGLWAVQTIAFFPYAYQIIANVLRNVNPTLEVAASDLGAGRWRVFRTVTLPLALPGVVSAALLVAVYVLSDFANPLIIAGRYDTLPALAWGQISAFADFKAAATIASYLLVIAGGFFVLSLRFSASRSFVTIGGRGGWLDRPPPPWKVRAVALALCSVLAGFILCVYGVLIAGAFTKIWGVNYDLTLDHWKWVSEHRLPLENSVKFSLIAAATSAMVSTVLAYLTLRRRFPGRRVLEFLSLLPAAVPGIFFGIGYILAFQRRPIVLDNAALLITLALFAWNLPTGYRAVAAALSQIDPSLEDAAGSLGAGTMRTFKDVMLPLLVGPFVTAFVTGFVRAITTLSVIIFLFTASTIMAPITIMTLVSNFDWGRGTAYTSTLIALALLVLSLFWVLRRGQTGLQNFFNG